MPMQLSNFTSRVEKAIRGLGSGLIAFIIILGLHFSGALGRLETWASDELRRHEAKDFVSPIEIVYLDQSSLQKAEKDFGMTWPWPREAYGNAIKFLHRAGAKAVVFDFLFTSRSSHELSDDKAFAKAAKENAPVFIGFQALEADSEEASAKLRSQPDIYSLPLAAKTWLPHGKSADVPPLPLWGAVAGVGDVKFVQDSDGLNRRARPIIVVGGKVYPSLALVAAWHLKGKPELKLSEAGLLTVGTDSYQLDDEGSFALQLRRYDPKFRAPLFDVAVSEVNLSEGQEPLVDPARFKGKVVLIGSSAPGLLDLRPSPMSKSMPGVELQAMALDNLLAGQSLKVAKMGWLGWLLLLLLCVSVARLSFSFRSIFILLPALFAALASLAIVLWFYESRSTLLPLATPLLGSLLSLAVAAGENYRLERRQRARVQGIFGQFLSPAVLAKLGAGGGRLDTGGETRELTVFFSDLAGFTSFSEKLSPHDLVVILNEYLEEMAEVIVGECDAYVDKYIGDAVMAFWNAPIEQPDHALRACRAAWRCQIRLGEIQAHLASLGLDAGDEGLVMRIGINTGPAVVGLMGSTRKLNYTVMGDTVNTASRLEGANKPYGSRIMIAESTRQAAGPAVQTRVLDLLRVKGKAEPTKVYELIGFEGLGKPLYDDAYIAQYHEAFGHYQKGNFNEAVRVFQACLQQRPKDTVSQLYLHRCEEFIKHPPESWDGVYVMKTK